MANRNTRIRGIQILDKGIDTAQIADSAVETLQINNDAVDKDKINADVAGVGLGQNADGSLEADLYEVGEVVVDVANDSFVLTDNSDTDDTKRDTIADLVSAMAGTGLTATAGVLSVDEHASGIVTDDDIIRNEVLEPDTGSDTDYTLANTPVIGTVNIYWNGMLQQPGTGEDYVIDGVSIVFADAIDASDLVIADYIIT